MDFVEGIEINTSHTNHPVADICDELKGVYPKEFKWTGWHPMCRCNATAKMTDFDAFLAKQQEYIDKWDGVVPKVMTGNGENGLMIGLDGMLENEAIGE